MWQVRELSEGIPRYPLDILGFEVALRCRRRLDIETAEKPAENRRANEPSERRKRAYLNTACGAMGFQGKGAVDSLQSEGLFHP